METDRPVEYDMYIVGWDMELMTSFGRYAVLNGGWSRIIRLGIDDNIKFVTISFGDYSRPDRV